MRTLDEANIADRGPEQVVVLVEESMAAISRERNRVRRINRIKCKLRLGRLLSLLYVIQC